MYKIIRSGCEIIWQPIDKNLGFAIVQEVTGKKGTADNPVLVDEEQAEKIRKLYEERNNDPKEPTVEPQPDPNAKIEKELEEFKIQSAMAQAETYEKLENDKLTIMTALAETYEANLGGK
ncbi:hypothetical protein [Peptoniphilus sp. BV3C26]|uniref:hypothetical protein n=1 Tax=Peptoniphilus sp. BV3C26 TaxID=1111134 RepID=UPI0003B8E99E|nr:hypothetical protein [Peptoniphilus sp. BV3C26]ERT62254.1 hypothetical protein HMPREF1253_1164 [Peptoniphilus sp. BV3C26]